MLGRDDLVVELEPADGARGPPISQGERCTVQVVEMMPLGGILAFAVLYLRVVAALVVRAHAERAQVRERTGEDRDGHDGDREADVADVVALRGELVAEVHAGADVEVLEMEEGREEREVDGLFFEARCRWIVEDVIERELARAAVEDFDDMCELRHPDAAQAELLQVGERADGVP